MISLTALTSLLVSLPLLVALSAAIAACVLLVMRQRDFASGLALGGFGGLLLTSLLTVFTPPVVLWFAQARPARNLRLILGAFTLAENTVAALAVACLIGALWLGLRKRPDP